jgi:hypothetical protein
MCRCLFERMKSDERVESDRKSYVSTNVVCCLVAEVKGGRKERC